MAPVTSASAAHVRLIPAPDGALARHHDALLADVAAGGPIARARFVTHWGDTSALKALAEAKRGALAEPLAREARAYHERLGAAPASLDALDRLARGEAVCAIAGQQPAPLGGPLYSFHKIASAVGTARRFAARTGMPCVPVFWMHGEDSDFDEIRTATIADAALTLHDLVLPEDLRREGGMIGHLPLDPLAALEAEALALWAGHAGSGDVRGLLDAARRGARDLGEAVSALVLHAFAGEGVVVIDPRLPAFRAAARPLIDRYLESAPSLTEAGRAGGDAIEALAGRRPLTDATLESFVFRIEDGARFKAGASDAADAALTPNVALRPAVQDAVLPTVTMAVGPGEAAYLAQLREVFEGLGVRPACPVPRFAATWLPPAAMTLAMEAGRGEDEVIGATDAVIRALAEARVPEDLASALDRAQRGAVDSLDAFAARAKDLDASLPQMVQSARGKVDFQFQRLRDGVIGKVRHQLEKDHPEWLRLRYYLLPGDRPQERRLASLEPLAWRGARAVREMCDLAEAHAAALERGVLEHHAVALDDASPVVHPA